MMRMFTTICISILIVYLSTILAYAQDIGKNALYPFTKGDRNDSLDIVLKRVNALLDTRKFYEKTYLQKKLVFLPVEFDSTLFSSSKPYIRIDDVPNKRLKKYFKQYYCEAYTRLKRAIETENSLIREQNKSATQDPRSSTTRQQSSLLKLKQISDYELLFVPKKFFTEISPTNPNSNKIKDSLNAYLDQILLGEAHNLDGYVNSINYVSSNFDHDSVPELIENLLEENLNLCKSLITNREAADLVSDAKINHTKLRGSNKLWAYTNVPTKTIYISPYLLRAVYNITLYKGKLFKLAELNNNRFRGLRTFLGGKIGSSVEQIDTAYFSNFVDLFSRNITFIIGHELAHIYLAKKEVKIDIESACDLYSAYFFLKRFNKIELGVFEDFLAKSVSSNELVFWGDHISKDQLINRYKELLNLKLKNDINIIINKLHTQDN